MLSFPSSSYYFKMIISNIFSSLRFDLSSYMDPIPDWNIFEVKSLSLVDISAILFNCYVTSPYSFMLSAIEEAFLSHVLALLNSPNSMRHLEIRMWALKFSASICTTVSKILAALWNYLSLKSISPMLFVIGTLQSSLISSFSSSSSHYSSQPVNPLI